ncbi:MAG: sulfur carrier protein ThiS [Tannerellaceae bacterium]|jgi:sulfur carrier protein|nr:sulfur carrier protein ThiS [Tannerellaceae bacterium]
MSKSTIAINGEEREITLPLSLGELIKQNNVSQPDMVSIQVNGEFVFRERFDDTPVNEGDEIDFLYFMGGGR